MTGPRSQPTARADLDARLTLAGASEPIAISLSGSSTGTLLTVERLEAVLAGGRVRAKGSLDSRSRAIEASATAEGLRLARLPMLPGSLRGLDGTLAADLALTGSDGRAGRRAARGSLAQASFGESPLPGLTLTARADGQRLDVVGASPDPARPGDESVFLRGGGPLQGDWPLRLQVDTAALPLQRVLDAIPAARQQAASLAARGTVTIDLPLRRPRDLRYASDGLVASGRLRDVEWKTEPSRIEGATDEATVSGLRLTATSSSPASPPPDRERAAGAASERGISETPASSWHGRGGGAPRGDHGTKTTALAGGTLAIDGRIAIAPTRSFDLTIDGGLDLATLQRLHGQPRRRRGAAAAARARHRRRPGPPGRARGQGRPRSLRPGPRERRPAPRALPGRPGGHRALRGRDARRTPDGDAAPCPCARCRPARPPACTSRRPTSTSRAWRSPARSADPTRRRSWCRSAATSRRARRTSSARPRPRPLHARRAAVARGPDRPRGAGRVDARARPLRADAPAARRPARHARGARGGARRRRTVRRLRGRRRPLRPARGGSVPRGHDARRPGADRPAGELGPARACGSTAA